MLPRRTNKPTLAQMEAVIPSAFSVHSHYLFTRTQDELRFEFGRDEVVSGGRKVVYSSRNSKLFTH